MRSLTPMLTLLLALALSLTATPAAAAVDVPAPLAPWVPWVLHGAQRELCPALADGSKVCEAPGRLELVVDNAGATFAASWRIFDTGVPALVALPGDGQRWPVDVEVDGKPAMVVADDSGTPSLQLLAGDHAVRGRFAWDTLPESIAIPASTAAVRLVLAGKEVAFVDRGDDGDRVWLQRQSAPEERDEDRLDVTAFRKIVDGVPLVVETQILLEVSGKGREITLPGAVLAGFTALALQSTLPARIEGNSIKVQVRPGRHALTLLARRDGDDRVLVSPKGAAAMGGEGSEEVWVFQADHAVRVATIEGPPSIVPEQTRLPDAWRALPAYRVLPGDTVTLVQQRRGDENPAPSQLSLVRTLWLDFDGTGYTVHDEIGGRFTGDRLRMGAGTSLGRVSTGDGPGDAFITQFSAEASAAASENGVEVRSPSLRVSADSRIEGHASLLPATSWAHDFQSVTATLHLPPGWRLAHASGVPVVETTWIRSWTLFELFLVVIITVAMGRLWGPVVGGVALFAMVLTFQEEGAPRGLWVLVTALAALHKVLPSSWEPRGVALVLRWLRMGAAVAVALVSLAFAVEQVRIGMYPVLEQPQRKVGEGDTWGRGQYGSADVVSQGFDGVATLSKKSEPEAAPAQKVPAGAFEELAGKVDQLEDVQLDSSRGSLAQSQSYADKVQLKKQRILQIDPGSVVQTGPGLPQWGFTTVSMRFTGPVGKDDQIALVLLSPPVNFALALLRVALIAFLVLVAFGFPGTRWPQAIARAFRGKGALFHGTAALLFALTASAARADEAAVAAEPAPSASMLEELKQRLLAPPPCAPSCAAISRVSLEASDASLRLRAEVHAIADVVVPLPGADQQWTAHTIIVDGHAHAGALRAAGSLWIALAPGRHDVVLEGALPRRDTVQLALPMVPHRASFTSSSWVLDGVHEDGVPDANLQLSRVAKQARPAPGADGGKDEGGEASVLPPFLRVERSLILGLSFEVETRVVRLSPAGTAVVVEIPLLPGESVTTDGVRAEGGKVLLSLGPNELEAHWSGVLPTVDKLVLQAHAPPAGAAPERGPGFVETWSLEASPVWHVDEQGIPPLHDDSPRDGGARAWRPWPGEALTLSITRPKGVPGQTITVEKTSQRVRPGVGSTDVTLTLTLRASRGGEHIVALPEGAVLLGATVDGRAQPLRPDQKSNQVRVPIVPGMQTVALEVRVPRGISFFFETPRFDGGSRSVNAEVLLDVPDDRWVLFAWGPRAGPAVLFWSFFVILVLAGISLARVPFSPLRTHHWVLLGLGLTQVPLAVAALVAGWLLALGWRKRNTPMPAGLFNLMQITLVFWTCVALVGLVASIHEGLLGAPDMQIAGNGSSQAQLRWFADHASGALPTGHVVNAPMAAYRLAMLSWALWLAFALLGWLRQGFAAFAEGGLWRALPVAAPRPLRPSSGPSSTSSTEAPVGAPSSAGVPSVSTVAPPGTTPPGAPPRDGDKS